MVNITRAVWLQAMLAHRYVTDKESRALYQAACSATKVSYREREYEDFVSDAGQAIEPLGLDLRRMVDERSGKAMLALVNTKSDDIAQLATTYTAQEIAFIKIMIEIIFTAPDEAYSIPTIQALKEATSMKPQMSKKAGEELINSLIRHGWLHRSESGRLSLSVRSILELQAYLKQEFPDHVLECTVCKDMVTRGSACSIPSCDVRVHQACLPLLGGGRGTSSGASRSCPGCRNVFQSTPVGEESAGSRRKPGSGSRRRRSDARGQVDTDEEEDGGEEDEDDEHEGAEPSTSRRRSAARGGARNAKRARRNNDEGSDDEGPSGSGQSEAEEVAEDDDDEEPTQAPRGGRRSNGGRGRQTQQLRVGKRRRSSAVRIAGGGFFDDEAGDDGEESEEEEEEQDEEEEEEEEEEE